MDLTGSFHRVLGNSLDRLGYGSDAVWTPDGHYVAVGGHTYGLAGGEISLGINITRPIRFYPDGQLAYGIDPDSEQPYLFNQSAGTKRAISSRPRRVPSSIPVKEASSLFLSSICTSAILSAEKFRVSIVGVDPKISWPSTSRCSIFCPL